MHVMHSLPKPRGIMAEPRKDAFATTSKTIIKNLERAGMEGYFCETSADARELVKSLVPEGSEHRVGRHRDFQETGVKRKCSKRAPTPCSTARKRPRPKSSEPSICSTSIPISSS